MEGTVGEIRMFAGTYAPLNWSICNGQTLAVRAYTALFAIIGTNYGGDGATTFKLPDLQGRTIVGTGQGAGLTDYDLGDSVGTETVSIGLPEMSAHNHILTYTPVSGTATITIKASADESGDPSPTGNFLGAPTALSESIYGMPQAQAQELPMANGTLAVQSVTGPQLTSLAVAANVPASPGNHENRQPSMALNYVICLQGNFPARN